MAQRFNKQVLTTHLHVLAGEVHDVDRGGDAITRAQALAKLLWDKALGCKKTEMNDEGREIEVVYRPEAWAIQLLYDRLEGRVGTASEEDVDRPQVLDKLRKAARERVNAATAQAVRSFETHPPKDD